ncbi:MAG: RNA-binding S4 domain-containing protein [Verrucomicrobiota bacterium]
MESPAKVRIDKFLWSVRLYKTRSMAAQACQGGRIKVNGQGAKPALAVKIGDIISASRTGWTKTVKIIGLLEKRVGAARVEEFIEDQTLPEEYQRAREIREAKEMAARHQESLKHKKKARPTKRDRRQMESWFKMHTGDKS